MEQKYESKTNIVISCWNAIEHTKVTLESLFATVHHKYFLTIIDNGSTDGTHEYLQKLKIPNECEHLLIISNKENKGAGEAINQGQEVSKKYGLEYTCLCNNDLFFHGNWLRRLEECMDGDINFGIVGTLRPAVDTIHHSQNNSAKFVVDHTPKGYSISEELQYFQDGYTFEQMSKMIVEKNHGGVKILRCPPNAVITCCALVRNSVSEKIGLFSDPQFKIYGSEDIDLSWRLQKAGFKCVILNDVYVHHFRHRSITSSNLDRDKYLLENNTKFYNKWKEEIFNFLDNEIKNGIDVISNMTTENNHEYFFLRRIDEKVKFMLEYIKNMNKSIIEKVVISNPIGNLYRKNHVLVLVVDKDKNFILGKKKDFYPEHIARMLGGGIKEGENPAQSAKREIEEELTIEVPVDSFNLLGSVVTQASTSEGDMEMQTWIYSIELPNSVEIKPSDDITGVQVFSHDEYINLVQAITNLSGEFVTDKFSFLWSDWGKIYGPIHQYGLDWYMEITEK